MSGHFSYSFFSASLFLKSPFFASNKGGYPGRSDEKDLTVSTGFYCF